MAADRGDTAGQGVERVSGVRLTHEAIMRETLWLHDLRYGNAHCERKWVEVCPKYQELIFEAGDRCAQPVEPTPTKEGR